MVETVTGDGPAQHIDELSRKYAGHGLPAPIGPHGRMILKVTPDKINTPRLLGR